MRCVARISTCFLAHLLMICPEGAFGDERFDESIISRRKSIWLKYEGPGKAYRPRDDAKAKLAESRIANTRPTRSLGEYAATYHSDLYGDLVIAHRSGQLELELAGYTTALTHWHNDSFYIRAPTRITYDWFVTFAPSTTNQPASVSVKHIGWDQDEPDRVYLRRH